MFKQKYQNKITIFQPPITKKGNCSLEEAATPIYDQIVEWSKTHPNQPIVVIGGSNGARLSGYIASMLKTKAAIENPIQACCIAGPFYGTKMINQPGFPGWMGGYIWRWVVKNIIYCDIVYEELSWKSDKAIEVIKAMQAGGKAGVRFKFYSSLADLQIQSLVSANPSIQGAEYYFSRVEGHSSLVRTAQEEIGRQCFEFIEKCSHNSF
jgi:hypothetical protein